MTKRKAGEAYKWADSVSRQLVMKDEVPRTSGDYRYAVVWNLVANTNETVTKYRYLPRMQRFRLKVLEGKVCNTNIDGINKSNLSQGGDHP